MVNPSYKLETMLDNYQQSLVKKRWDEDFLQRKNDMANKLMNVILIGGEDLNAEQVKTLKNFYERFSKDYSNDAVVNLISQVLNFISTDEFKMNQTIKSREASDDVRAIVQTFMDVTDLNSLSPEKKLKVVSYAVTRLQDAKNEFSNYSDLSQFAKILTICWDKPYLHIDQKAVVNCLLDLIKDVKPSDGKFALEFKNLAMTLIKRYESTKIPDDIKNHPAYHGKALDGGFSQLKEMLKTTGTTTVSLQEFAVNYCKDLLKRNEYLIRNSSTMPSTDFQGIHYFIVTISYKYPNGTLGHTRLTRMETKEGKISWKWEIPSNQNFEKALSFNKIEDYIASTALKNFTPSLPPNTEDVRRYVANRYSV